jgi:hypothetical protein
MLLKGSYSADPLPFLENLHNLAVKGLLAVCVVVDFQQIFSLSGRS